MVSKKQIAEIESVIGTMNLGELLALRQGLNERITTLQDAEKDNFIAEMRARAEQLNLNLNDLAPQLGIIAARRTRTNNDGAERASPAVKYRDDKGNSWSGRGLQPKWMTAAIAEGRARSKDDFLIK